ncbi:MAG: NAD(P)/FAD-dependent oxidoreductase [Gammaproteobacteria bacterium]|nr:NAD(P)/FAD-dependent oxidoreductase [Gammaproteobacteria bacterium]
MCAISAGQRGRKVLVLDHAEKVGKKILIAGGGRCNFTNLWVDAENYISGNAHFCKSALSRFSQYDFLNLIDKYQIRYEERAHGQLFCRDKASVIVDLLLDECSLAGVDIHTEQDIQSVHKNESFQIQTQNNHYCANSLVIASGGLSIPKMGATDIGHRIAEQFGIACTALRPGLVSLTLNSSELNNYASLSGISVDASVSHKTQFFREAVLFTHKGLSGPAILQISNYWTPGDHIEINLLPDTDLQQQIEQWQQDKPNTELKTLMSTLLSKRLVEWLISLYLENKPIRQYQKTEIQKIINSFQHWQIMPSGTTGYSKAEVTLGGIDTHELSSRTFEAKKQPGLYFIGEVIDVTGWLGGYNLQWAWASGYCAGQAV